jgi:hypothetical protein
MNRALAVAAILEAATGLALIIDPALVARLLLGDVVAGAGAAVGRVAGLGLLSLAIACWPIQNATLDRPALAMLAYNSLVASYLGFLGIGGQWVGRLLWPVAAIHAVMTTVIVFVWINDRQYSIKTPRHDTK